MNVLKHTVSAVDMEMVTLPLWSPDALAVNDAFASDTKMHSLSRLGGSFPLLIGIQGSIFISEWKGEQFGKATFWQINVSGCHGL